MRGPSEIEVALLARASQIQVLLKEGDALHRERVTLRRKLLRRQVRERHSDAQTEEGIFWTGLESSDVLGECVLVRARHQRVVSVHDGERQVVVVAEHEPKTEAVVAQVVGAGSQRLPDLGHR